MIHFLLVPDASSALRLKRLVAEQGGRTGVIVGAWPELLAQAKNCYILPLVADEWQARLAEGVDNLKDAFWSKSFAAVHAEEQKNIVALIGEHLAMLLEGAGVAGRLEGLERLAVGSRLQRYVMDFARLHEAMGHILPPGLLPVRQMLRVAPERRIRSMRVYHSKEWPHLNWWQEALIGHLNTGAMEPELFELRGLLGSACAVPDGKSGSSLYHMQQRLFSLPPKQALDTSVQWLVVRDYLQEVEVAAGMIQRALRDDPSLQQADIALLLPTEAHYSHAIRSVFAAAGIAVSGLRAEYVGRDLGAEAVHNLLLSFEKPASVIALASLLVSPLMPWGKEEGNRLAQDVVDLRFRLKAFEGGSPEAAEMLAIIRAGAEKPLELAKRLGRFSALLNKDEGLKTHRLRAQGICREIIGKLDGATSIFWPALRGCALPKVVTIASSAFSAREGVAVFYEDNEPWRRVQRLYVLGCFEGHYPSLPAGSTIFTDDDIRELNEALRLSLVSSKECGERQRELFKRQIGMVKGEVTFLLPSRDALGKPLAPSASLTFAAALFSGVKGGEGLMINLESNEERLRARDLALAGAGAPLPPRGLLKEDLWLQRNLLEIGRKDDGTLVPETPTRLDTLLVSPLAWVLDRLKLRQREWAPETLSVMIKGTLVHDVFEHLFAVGHALPEWEEIERDVPVLLDEGIKKKCPFLVRSEWKVELEHLKQDCMKAARQWSVVLQALDAKVVATEVSLQGMLDGVPIHGNADLLLELAGGQLLVVDYKKSSSTGRRKRMEQGYDLQAKLYRIMIQSGGLQEKEVSGSEGEERRVLERRLNHYKSAGEIGTLYYLMNDQYALANTRGWLTNIGGVDEIPSDASRVALVEIVEAFGQLREGRVSLNGEGDKDEMYKIRGLSTFALENPLVQLFMKPGTLFDETFENDGEPTDE